ncbi:MAG TPA: hypothetical protein ENN17_08005 [bacterium]|nr:hypothetical protein [bacterium]
MPDDVNTLRADHCGITDRMIEVSGGVSLRVISFLPTQETARPPVVFVAGWISRIESWREVLHEMSRDFPIHYIETREKVSSRIRGRAAFTVDVLGQDLVRIVHHLGLNHDYILFGSSLGATVILDCYRKLTDSPRCLILIGPNAEFHVPLFWKAVVLCFYPCFYFLLRPVIKWYLRTFRMRVDADYAQYEKYGRALDAADPFKLKKAAMAFWKYRVWDILHTVRAPVLILGGSSDKLHEPENLRQMAEILPDARYLDLGTNRETHSFRVVGIVRAFLDEPDQSRTGEGEDMA